MMSFFGDDLVESKNSRYQSTYVWLAQITLSTNEIIRVAAIREGVTFLSNVYQPFPFRVSSLNEETSGELPIFDVFIYDFTGNITSNIRNNNDLGGNRVTLIKIPYALLSTPVDGDGKPNYRTWRGSVASTSYGQAGISLSLESKVVTRISGPRGVMNAFSCTYVFKDPETCQYDGPEKVCDKSIDGNQGCTFYGNIINNGSFPSVILA